MLLTGDLNSSGTLQTNNAANIFDSLGRQGQTALSTVSLQAALPEETKTALTDLFRHYVPGTVAQSLIDHASFTGGKVIVTGVNLTTTQRDDLVAGIQSKVFSPGCFHQCCFSTVLIKASDPFPEEEKK